MISSQGIEPTHPQHIGNGLIMRPSTQQDTDDLLQLVGTVFNNMREGEEGETRMTHLVRRVMSGNHPSTRPDNFTLIEDTRHTGRHIVGCTGLLHHTWEYEGIPFSIGRPEVIATYPEYRQQGLIRTLFSMVHARSAAAGHLVQAITGIPYFYRQFDYEYALDSWDTCTIEAAHILGTSDDLAAVYTLRDATIADIPYIQKLYENQRCKGLVSQVVDEGWWSYQIQTWQNGPHQNINSHVQMIEYSNEAKGYLITSTPQSKKYMQIWDLEVADDVNLHDAMPAILRELYYGGVQERENLQQDGMLNELRFMLGQTHPAFHMLNTIRIKGNKPAFAWYIRVGDLAQFLSHIAPVLESRLANAGGRAFDGELKLDFYRSGLRLVFEHGHFITAEAWQRSLNYVKPDAGFPPNVFLQLLFGRRSLTELCYIFPDVWVNDEAEFLLQVLFPPKASWVLPVW
jgi:N-acetylglutamate synthase-like GNAT family acetyltransferase